MTRNFLITATTAALTLFLAACGSGDEPAAETTTEPAATTEEATTEAEESPATEEPATEEATTDAPAAETDTAAPDDSQAWTADDEAGYQEQYDLANQHLLEHYGILETAELCDALAAPMGPDELVENFSNEAGIPYDSEEHVLDSGTFNAIYDWCDS